MERWRKTSCGPTLDVLAETHDMLEGTHDVLAGDYQIGDIFGEQSEPIDI